MRVSLASHRQLHFEARLARWRASRGDRPAVAFDDRFHDPQAETQATGLRLFAGAARETLEDRAGFDLRHARAFVLHPGRYLVALLRGPDAHDAVLRREFAGVRQQVDEDLRQARAVTVDARQIRGKLQLQALP